MLWDERIKVEKVVVMAQNITCRVKMDSSQFYLSIIYGFNDGMAMRCLRRHLSSLHGSILQNPWMIA